MESILFTVILFDPAALTALLHVDQLVCLLSKFNAETDFWCVSSLFTMFNTRTIYIYIYHFNSIFVDCRRYQKKL